MQANGTPAIVARVTAGNASTTPQRGKGYPMRLAFAINPIRNASDGQVAELSLFEISPEMPITERVIMQWTRANDKADWKFSTFQTHGTTALHLLAAKRTMNEIYKCIEEGTAGQQSCNIHDPLSLIEVIEKWDNGKQAVYDERIGRFRLAHLLKDKGNIYEAVGTGITVECEDEKTAVRRLQSEITDAMVEKPEQAAKLAEWFANGRKIKEAKSGKGPVAIDRSVLAKAGAAKK